MSEMAYANVTNSVSSFIPDSSLIPLLTFLVFITIVIGLFALIKNFRYFIYGAVPLAAAFVIYKVSKWTAVEFSDGNESPWHFIYYSFIFVCLSIAAGWLVSKTKFVKRIEEVISEADDGEVKPGRKK